MNDVRAAAALALAFATMLAGCGDGAGPQASPVLPAAPAGTMLLGGCTGFEASAPLRPTALSDAQPPAGWPPRELSAAGVLGFACQRVALGPYERGPVRLVAELHNNFVAPAACDERGEGFADRALAGILVDDAALADELRRTHGMPARLGAIHEDAAAQDGAAVRTWTWSEAGGPASTLSFVDLGQAATSGLPLRIFWSQGDGVGRLDLEMSGYAAGAGPAQGDLHGTFLRGPFAGSSAPHREHTAAGAFRHFADSGCTAP